MILQGRSRRHEQLACLQLFTHMSCSFTHEQVVVASARGTDMLVIGLLCELFSSACGM